MAQKNVTFAWGGAKVIYMTKLEQLYSFSYGQPMEGMTKTPFTLGPLCISCKALLVLVVKSTPLVAK